MKGLGMVTSLTPAPADDAPYSKGNGSAGHIVVGGSDIVKLVKSEKGEIHTDMNENRMKAKEGGSCAEPGEGRFAEWSVKGAPREEFV